MKKPVLFLLTLCWTSMLFAQSANTGTLPYKFEELTSSKFVTAVEKAGGVCVIPLGIIEKHGPHLPLGSDLFESREWVCTAAGKEYAVVFPPYYMGQIFEAKHQPGTLAYSNELVWRMLEETCGELSRNGLKKIILANGHGGNEAFLEYFCQSQLAGRKDFIVVLFRPGSDPVLDKEIRSLSKAKLDQHAGEGETAMMSFIRPDLVDTDAIKSQSGLDQARLKALRYGYTGIWWFARFPNHYASDVAEPNKKLGELLITKDASQLAELIKYLKTSNTIEQLQQEFYNRAQDPTKK